MKGLTGEKGKLGGFHKRKKIEKELRDSCDGEEGGKRKDEAVSKKEELG